MATQTINYGSTTAYTFGVESTASSSTFVAGRESSQIDNTTNKFVDYIFQGKVRVGTTPTSGTFIKIYVWGSDTSLATTALDVLDGTDSTETITSAGVRDGMLHEIESIYVDATTSDRDYPIKARGLAQYFGGVMPEFHGLFLAHNTGVNLNATGGNHYFNYTGVKYDVA